jgi:hypothetical protein
MALPTEETVSRRINWHDLNETLSSELGFDLEFVSSFLDVDWDTETTEIPDLDSPFKFGGSFRLQDPYTWNDEAAHLTSPLLVNPTWRQVLEATNELFKLTNDGHHIFLEAWVQGDDPGIIEVHYGS